MSDGMLSFISSYPESGGQWAGYLVRAYLDSAEGAPSARPLPSDADLEPYHQATPLPMGNLDFGTQVQVRSGAMFGISEGDGPDVVTTHDAAVVHEGLSLFSTFFTERVAVVVRDPRDVVVSLAERQEETSLDEAVDLMADRERVIQHDSKVAHAVSSWRTHVATWLKYEAVPTRFFRYEDLRSDPEEELTQLLGFLAIEETVDRSRVSRAVDAVPFQRVKQRHDKAALEKGIPDHLRVCREGRVGVWKEELSEEQIRRIERVHGKLMKAAGYQPLFEGELERSAPEAPESGEPHMTMEEPQGAAADTGLGSEPAEDGAAVG